MHKAKLDKILHANLFNSTILSAMLYANETGYYKEKRTEISYETEGYKKIHTGNIIAWAHPNQDNSRTEQSEPCNCRVTKAEVPLVWTEVS